MTDEVFPGASELSRRMEREADPTKSSTLHVSDSATEDGETSHHHYEIVSDGNERFVNLEEKLETADAEMIVVRILKGIVNVSDVVPGKGAYADKRFSKIMPFEKIVEETDDNHMQADIILLARVFCDGDHKVYRESNELQNIARDGKKVVYYDFGQAYKYFFRNEPFKRWADFKSLRNSENALDILTIAIEKARKIRKNIEGKEGEGFIRAITQKMDLKGAFLYGRSVPENGPTDYALLIRDNLIQKIDRFVSEAADQLQPLKQVA